jgi:hypothetical protein
VPGSTRVFGGFRRRSALVALAAVIISGSALTGTGAAADGGTADDSTRSVRVAPTVTVLGPETALVGERLQYNLFFKPSAEDPPPLISVDSNVVACRRAPFTPEVITGFAGLDCGRRATESDVPSFTATFEVTFQDGSTATASVTTEVSRRQQPDGLVRRGTRPFIGNDVYSRKATQVATGTLRHGTAVKFTFRVQNDGPLRDKFLIDAEPYSAVGNERWSFNGRDVTDEVATTYLYTKWLDPGESADITLTLTRWRWAELGASDVLRVRFVSQVASTRTDTVAIRVTVGDERR